MNESCGFLDSKDLDPDPVIQFGKWFDQARAAGVREPEAMCLATAGPDGAPSARIVLLRGFSAEGFVFYTSYESRKGREIERNPKGALLFYWPEVSRQVRLEGTLEKVTAEQSREYFESRPFGSRLGAWVSEQSRVIEGRRVLDERMRELRERYGPAGPLPLPPYWGGYRLLPEAAEFWQQGADRLHDRFLYRRGESGWSKVRLAP